MDVNVSNDVDGSDGSPMIHRPNYQSKVGVEWLESYC
jgi:hypothetical protein